MALVWTAPLAVMDRLQEVKAKYHSNLESVSIVVELSDAQPFKNNRLNLGNIRKFSAANKIWQKGDFDFCITLVGEVWKEILKNDQCDALLDLHLTRIEPVCEPQVVVENKKRIVCKDDYGRIILTEEQKLDKNGNPRWRIVPIDLGVLSQNVRRYGFWFDDLVEFRSIITEVQAISPKAE
ncbi:MAG: hypothetical protein M0R50_08070 [Candidatus Cloacimonetes bacterium]|jgi:hypothetical protein|nr:hypothetical protein [Candidatus Cloacimonadota bacterium]